MINMKKEIRIVFIGHGEDWLPCMIGDIDRIENAYFVNSDFPISFSNKYLRRIVRHIVLSPKIPYFIQKPWFKKIAKVCISDDKNEPLIVVFFDWNRLGSSRHFLRFMRSYYCDIRLGYIFTNIVKISGALLKYDILKDLKSLYDIVYTFEEDDASNYGFTFSQLFNASYCLPPVERVENRVFFVGVAKDRYPKLLSVYNRLSDIKVDALFYINRVPSKDQQISPGLVYNETIPYSKTQELEQSSTCLLDIVQGGAKGYTLKVRSAVSNNKLLITNNPYIKQAPFYNPDYILYYEKPEDIKPSFFENPERVRYTEEHKNYFSLEEFVERMKRDLNYGN